MDKEEEHKIVALRKEIPVGITEGLNLLREYHGNLEEAVIAFQKKRLQIVINKTNTSEELALKHLKQNNFDINLTLKSLEEELYSITERIFRKFKSKETVLSNLFSSIEQTRDLKRNFWIDFEKLDVLNEQERAFVIIQEWLNFEAWEGDIHFHLDIVTESIRNALEWTEMADNLQNTNERYTQIYAGHQNTHESLKNCYERLIKDTEYQKCYQFFRDNEEIFTEKLYDFVKENIRYFP